MNRILGGLVILGFLAVPAGAEPDLPAPAKPGIEALTARSEGGRAWVSYEVARVMDAEVEERIHSGIPVTFQHKVQVLSKRAVPLMPSKVIAQTTIETRVEYDSLTRRYDLLRRIEHKIRQKKQGPLTEEQRKLTDSLEEMRTWMTRFDEIPVFDPARELRGRSLRVRVEINLGRRYILLVFPGTRSVSAETPLGP
jgi:hypothetical protein